jgi:hypothetical protein
MEVYSVYTEHYVKFWDSGFELAEYIKPKIQRTHLFADLRVHISSSTPAVDRTVLRRNIKSNLISLAPSLSPGEQLPEFDRLARLLGQLVTHYEVLALLQTACWSFAPFGRKLTVILEHRYNL